MRRLTDFSRLWWPSVAIIIFLAARAGADTPPVGAAEIQSTQSCLIDTTIGEGDMRTPLPKIGSVSSTGPTWSSRVAVKQSYDKYLFEDWTGIEMRPLARQSLFLSFQYQYREPVFTRRMSKSEMIAVALTRVGVLMPSLQGASRLYNRFYGMTQGNSYKIDFDVDPLSQRRSAGMTFSFR